MSLNASNRCSPPPTHSPSMSTSSPIRAATGCERTLSRASAREASPARMGDPMHPRPRPESDLYPHELSRREAEKFDAVGDKSFRHRGDDQMAIAEPNFEQIPAQKLIQFATHRTRHRILRIERHDLLLRV